MPDNTDDKDDKEERIAAISIQSRLLPFWREVPRAWFIQFEAVVDPLRTSDDQKFRYVLQQLQSADLQHLTDILYNPPATDKYPAIKNRLLAVYEQSEVRNFQKLISGLELGDQKPTQLLRKMRELSGGMITEDGLKIEWLNHLPSHVRVILSVNNESSLDTLAAMADKMLEYVDSSTSTIATINNTTPSKMDLLEKKIEKLTLEIAELRGRSSHRNRSYRRPFHSRSRSRTRSANRRPAPRPGDPTWECKYHFRFGNKAKRCESPCCKKTKKPEN